MASQTLGHPGRLARAPLALRPALLARQATAASRAANPLAAAAARVHTEAKIQSLGITLPPPGVPKVRSHQPAYARLAQGVEP